MPANSCELLVIGGGGAGMAAALAGADAGADVLVVEKSQKLGGTYAFSSGLVWVPANRSAREAGIEDSIDLARHHINNLNGGKSVPEVLEAYLQRGPETLDFLAEHGVPLDWIPRYPDYYAEQPGGLMEGRYLSSPVFDGARELPAEWRERAEFSPYYTDVPASWPEIQAWGGYGLISEWDWKLLEERKQRGVVGWGGATTGYMMAACLRTGRIRFQLGTKLLELDKDASGRVVGATVSIDGGGPEHIAARAGVVLAAGGYDHNPEMQRQFDPHPNATPFSNPSVDGSGGEHRRQRGRPRAFLSGLVRRQPGRPAVRRRLLLPGPGQRHGPLRHQELPVREPALLDGLRRGVEGDLPARSRQAGRGAVLDAEGRECCPACEQDRGRRRRARGDAANVQRRRRGRPRRRVRPRLDGLGAQ
ncbi:MAG: FAD-dependent oxidoreductase [Chloroflexi bacterium]|nr:MAG: FAD-dependent oxidoreductase [Chloroflexota bacterium]